jgi:hypothetical protein
MHQQQIWSGERTPRSRGPLFIRPHNLPDYDMYDLIADEAFVIIAPGSLEYFLIFDFKNFASIEFGTSNNILIEVWKTSFNETYNTVPPISAEMAFRNDNRYSNKLHLLFLLSCVESVLFQVYTPFTLIEYKRMHTLMYTNVPAYYHSLSIREYTRYIEYDQMQYHPLPPHIVYTEEEYDNNFRKLVRWEFHKYPLYFKSLGKKWSDTMY